MNYKELFDNHIEFQKEFEKIQKKRKAIQQDFDSLTEKDKSLQATRLDKLQNNGKINDLEAKEINMSELKEAYDENRMKFQEELDSLQEKRILLEQEFFSLNQKDKNLQSARAIKLKSYWRQACDRERKARERNAALLKDFGEFEERLHKVQVETSKLERLKKKCEDELTKLYPEWRYGINLSKVKKQLEDGGIKIDATAPTSPSPPPATSSPQKAAVSQIEKAAVSQIDIPLFKMVPFNFEHTGLSSRPATYSYRFDQTSFPSFQPTPYSLQQPSFQPTPYNLQQPSFQPTTYSLPQPSFQPTTLQQPMGTVKDHEKFYAPSFQPTNYIPSQQFKVGERDKEPVDSDYKIKNIVVEDSSISKPLAQLTTNENFSVEKSVKPEAAEEKNYEMDSHSNLVSNQLSFSKLTVNDSNDTSSAPIDKVNKPVVKTGSEQLPISRHSSNIDIIKSVPSTQMHVKSEELLNQLEETSFSKQQNIPQSQEVSIPKQQNIAQAPIQSLTQQSDESLGEVESVSLMSNIDKSYVPSAPATESLGALQDKNTIKEESKTETSLHIVPPIKIPRPSIESGASDSFTTDPSHKGHQFTGLRSSADSSPSESPDPPKPQAPLTSNPAYQNMLKSGELSSTLQTSHNDDDEDSENELEDILTPKSNVAAKSTILTIKGSKSEDDMSLSTKASEKKSEASSTPKKPSYFSSKFSKKQRAPWDTESEDEDNFRILKAKEVSADDDDFDFFD